MHRVLTQVLQQIATTLESFNAVLGLEALNEPWQYTPLDVLKAFYWDAYWAVRAAAPHWLFVIQVFPCEPRSDPRKLARNSRPRVPARQDSFRLEAWSGFMKGCPGVAIDTHVYQAWFDIQSQQSFLEDACSWRKRIRAVQVCCPMGAQWVPICFQPIGMADVEGARHRRARCPCLWVSGLWQRTVVRCG